MEGEGATPGSRGQEQGVECGDRGWRVEGRGVLVRVALRGKRRGEVSGAGGGAVRGERGERERCLPSGDETGLGTGWTG